MAVAWFAGVAALPKERPRALAAGAIAVFIGVVGFFSHDIRSRGAAELLSRDTRELLQLPCHVFTTSVMNFTATAYTTHRSVESPCEISPGREIAPHLVRDSAPIE